jgi:hypothetical protein
MPFFPVWLNILLVLFFVFGLVVLIGMFSNSETPREFVGHIRRWLEIQQLPRKRRNQ